MTGFWQESQGHDKDLIKCQRKYPEKAHKNIPLLLRMMTKRHWTTILQTNGSDNDLDSNAGPEIISVDDNDEEMSDNIHLEAAEECNEAKLG